MRRREIIITIRAVSMQTLAELRSLESMTFRVLGCAPTMLAADPRNELGYKPHVCGTITSASVEIVPAKKRRRRMVGVAVRPSSKAPVVVPGSGKRFPARRKT